MSDDPLHDALLAFVSDDEPPMGLTAGEVVKAGRRSRRRRRVASIAGAVAAIAVLTVVGAAATPRFSSVFPHTPTFGSLAPCTSTPEPRPSQVGDPDRYSPSMSEWAAASLTCVLADQVPRLLPDAQFAQEPGAPAGPLVGYPMDNSPLEGNRVDAMALIRDQHGTGDFYISVSVPTAGDRQGAVEACQRPDFPHCAVSTPEPGVTAIVAKQSPAVTVFRGHCEIHIEASDTDRRSVNGKPPVATRDAPVLTSEQLLTLALSPQMYLFP